MNEASDPAHTPINEPEIYLPLNARSLSFRWRGTTYELSIEGQHLTTTIGSGPFRTTSKTPLSGLMEELVVDTPRSATGQFHATRFVYSLIAALIIQFSVVPRFVPFLAPVLFGFALIHFVGFVRHIPAVQQTRVRDHYGGVVIAIPHLPDLELSRTRFEDQLRDAIHRTRKLSF